MSPIESALPAIVTVLGGGAWGSALARLLIANHNQTRIWSRHGTEDLATLLQGTEIIVSAISMKGVPSVVQRVQAITLKESVILVTATKGLDPQTTATPSQIWQQTFPKNPVVVLSGPNLSKEIAQGLPAATVVASDNAQAAQRVQKLFASENFRVYTNADPLGTEQIGRAHV